MSETVTPSEEKKKKKVHEVKRGSVIIRIHETPNGNYEGWTLTYYNTDGKRVRLKRSTLADAKKRAGEIADELSSNLGAGLLVSPADVAEYSNALEAIRSTGKRLSVVAAEYADAAQLLRKGVSLQDCVRFYNEKNLISFEASKLSDLLPLFLYAKEAENLSCAHLKDLKNRLTKAAIAFDCPIHKITAAEVSAWLQGMRHEKTRKPLSPQTRINYRSALENFFGSAIAKQHLPKGWSEIADVARPKVTRQRIEIYTPEEMTKLLYAAAGFISLPCEGVKDKDGNDLPAPTEAQKNQLRELVPYLAIGAFGMTRNSTNDGEIMELQWSDIDFDANQICLDNGTAKVSDRYIPMQSNLRAWLLPFAKKSGPVVPSGVVRRRNLLCALTSIKWIPNGLRKSAISYRLALTKDVAKVADEAGNSPAMIYSRYRKALPKEVGEKWSAIMPPDAGKIISLPGQAKQELPAAASV